MNKYKKPVINELELGLNPCVTSLSIPIIKWQSSSFKKDKDDDILYDSYNIEVDSHTKFYRSYDRRLLLNRLTPSSSKLLLWLMLELNNNKDYLWINKKRYMDETGVSYNTYKASIKDLHKHNLIQPSIQTDVYWINPHYFFPGNRVKKYPNNIIIKQDRTEE